MGTRAPMGGIYSSLKPVLDIARHCYCNWASSACLSNFLRSFVFVAILFAFLSLRLLRWFNHQIRLRSNFGME